MSPIVGLIKALVPHFPTQQELDEAYLNQAVDIYDVERRMAEIDHRMAAPASDYYHSALGGLLH